MKNRIVAVLTAFVMLFGVGVVNASQAHAVEFVIASPGTIYNSGYRHHAFYYAEAAPGVRLTYLSVQQYFQWGQRVKVYRRYLPDTYTTVWHTYGYPTNRQYSSGYRLSGRNSVPCLPGATPVRSILNVSAKSSSGHTATSNVIGPQRRAYC